MKLRTLTLGLLSAVIAPLVLAQNYTVLYSFRNGPDGGAPAASLILDEQGNLYGTTNGGGDLTPGRCSLGGCGVVFKLDPSGNETVLYSFHGYPDGGKPAAALLRDPLGNLYGTTAEGGVTCPRDNYGCGVVFKLDHAGNESVLHTFTGSPDGSFPTSNLIPDPAGNLYGTTQAGGEWDKGTAFKMNRAGHVTVLHSFSGGPDGDDPMAGLVEDASGNLYGTTNIGGLSGYGVVFKLDPAGHETVLHSFTGGRDGANPSGAVLLDPEFSLYGTTCNGGSTVHLAGVRAPCGVIFKLGPSGRETVLHRFHGAGYCPESVVRDAQGNLYGTTRIGGRGHGVVFKLDSAGNYSLLYAFYGLDDGGTPAAGVVLDGAGNVYGTTEIGGAFGGGVVYKIAP